MVAEDAFEARSEGFALDSSQDCLVRDSLRQRHASIIPSLGLAVCATTSCVCPALVNMASLSSARDSRLFIPWCWSVVAPEKVQCAREDDQVLELRDNEMQAHGPLARRKA